MKKMNNKKVAKVLQLFEERTRCLIMARHGYIGVNAWGDYFNKSIQLDDRITEELFGTRDLVELGIKWGLLPKDSPMGKPKKKVFRKKKNKRD